jgi:cystathionine gamma-lyase
VSARGDSTRAVHAGLPGPADGKPFLPGPTFAAAYHLSGDVDSAPHGYGRYSNPTWSALEAALGELEGATAVVFGSGMAAVTAVVVPALGPGDVLVAPADAYTGIRQIASEVLAPRGVQVRLVPTEQSAFEEAVAGATLVWAESPSNPGLDVLDLEALAARARREGAMLAVDNTLAGPLRQRPLELGAHVSVTSASKHLTGHSDLILGYVAVHDPERADALDAWRRMTGAVAGPFEAWLAHRSLATAALRLERQEANARALAEVLGARDDVTGVRWSGVGSLLVFDAGSRARAEAFLAAADLVADATSFGGAHSSAERRERWGSDAVPPGFIRLSAGIEDTDDLVADVLRALDVSRP